MKKISECIKKYDNISVLVLIVILILGYCMDFPMGNNDDIWNYMNACKIVNGYKIYIDTNIIITPLFYIIGCLILKIFGTNLLVWKLYNVLIMTFCLFIIYLIMKSLCKNKFRSLVYLLIIIIETIMLSTGGANYNILVVGIVLLGVYLNLKWLENKEKHNIIQALIMFLVIFTKQNIGLYYLFAIIIYQICVYKNIKDILKQLIIFIIELFIAIIVFYNMGILDGFINYSILGIKEFATNNIYINKFLFIEIMLFILLEIEVFVFFMNMKNIEKEEKQKSILLMCTSLPIILMSYPIVNDYHIMISKIVLSITIIYIVDKCILGEFLSERKLVKILKIILISIIVAISISSFLFFIDYIDNVKQYDIFDKAHCYYGGFFSNEEGYEKYIEITNYIKNQEKKVVILSTEASIYNTPLKINNGPMDLPLLGNMGFKGEENIINIVSNMDNTQFLILKNEEELHSQESKLINKYVRDNFNKVGTICNFEIYEK